VWEWVLSSAELTEARQRYLISTVTRRSDGVHARVVAEAPPGPTAQRVAPTLEDAYLHAVAGRREAEPA